MKKNLKSKKSTTSFREKMRGLQVNLATLVLPMIIILLILSLYLVARGNHALFYNTKYFESTELLYKKPDTYSLADMKVEIQSTYYSIKEVVYVFRSVGTKFNVSEGILTQGYYLGMYGPVLWVVGVSFLYIVLELFKCFAYAKGIKAKIKENKWWGRGFILACILFVVLVLQLLFPLL